MKRFSLIIVIALMVNMAMAQGNAVASAYNYLKNGQPDRAKVEIDKAVLHDDTKGEAKTWFYRGNIYIQLYTFAHMTDGIDKGTSGEELIARRGKPESMRNYRKLENGERWYYPFDLTVYLSNGKVDHLEFPGQENFEKLEDGTLLDVASISYKKSYEIDPKFFKMELNPQNAELGLGRVARLYYNEGVEGFKEKPVIAFKSFIEANEINNYLGTSDTNLILYTGYTAETIKDTASVIKYYSILAKKGSHNVGMYVSLANVLLGQNKVEEALRVVKQGRSVLPKNQNLLLTEANIYLQNDRAKEAEVILKEAAKADPSNANLRFAIGANYDKMINDTTATQEQRDEAMANGKAAYRKAIELDPDHFDANYNMGAMLNNKAAGILAIAKNLPLGDKKYDVMMDEAKVLLVEAKPYLEKCHQLQPKDRNTMIILRGIYTQTKDYDNLKEINAALKAK